MLIGLRDKKEDTLTLVNSTMGGTASWTLPLIIARREDRERNRFMFSKLKKGLIQEFAEGGGMDGYFDDKTIVEAIKGQVPKEYNFHHILPLYFSGDNKHGNIVLTHKIVHMMLNKYIYKEAEKKARAKEFNTRVFLQIPQLPMVMKLKDLPLFMSEKDIEKEGLAGLKEEDLTDEIIKEFAKKNPYYWNMESEKKKYPDEKTYWNKGQRRNRSKVFKTATHRSSREVREKIEVTRGREEATFYLRVNPV